MTDLLALAERRPMPHMHNDQACFDWMYEADAALREAHEQRIQMALAYDTLRAEVERLKESNERAWANGAAFAKSAEADRAEVARLEDENKRLRGQKAWQDLEIASLRREVGVLNAEADELQGYIDLYRGSEEPSTPAHADWCNTQRPIPHGALAERGPCNCKGWNK